MILIKDKLKMSIKGMWDWLPLKYDLSYFNIKHKNNHGKQKIIGKIVSKQTYNHIKNLLFEVDSV